IAARTNLILKIATVEAAHDDTGAAHPELFENIGAHGGRRRRREGDHLRTAERLRDARDPAKARPKIVSPFADAVCLVDRDHRETTASEAPLQIRRLETLGRHIQELEIAAHGASKTM